MALARQEPPHDAAHVSIGVGFYEGFRDHHSGHNMLAIISLLLFRLVRILGAGLEEIISCTALTDP